MGGWVHGQTIDRLMDGWIDGKVGGWMDDGQTDGGWEWRTGHLEHREFSWWAALQCGTADCVNMYK